MNHEIATMGERASKRWLNGELTTVAAWTERREDLGKLVLRVTVGGLMLFHGFDKLANGVQGVAHELTTAGLPAALAYGVYLGEVVAPLLILVGIWTRPAALLYAATILFATLLVHRADALRITEAGGWGIETNVFYILTPLALCLLGAGRYALGPERTTRRKHSVRVH